MIFIIMNLRKFIRNTLIEQLNNKGNIEFHLSTESNLKNNLPFSKQIRTISSPNERGDMGITEKGNYIYSTNSPEQWYQQFEMELADASEFIPQNLYIVKVKKPSSYGFLNQSINKQEDVVVLQKIPNNADGTPNFNAGELIKQKYL